MIHASSDRWPGSAARVQGKRPWWTDGGQRVWVDRGQVATESAVFVDNPVAPSRGCAYRRYQPGGVTTKEPERLVRQSLGSRNGGFAGLFRAAAFVTA